MKMESDRVLLCCCTAFVKALLLSLATTDQSPFKWMSSPALFAKTVRLTVASCCGVMVFGGVLLSHMYDKMTLLSKGTHALKAINKIQVWRC